MSPSPRQSVRLRSVTSAQNTLLKDLRKAFTRSEPVDGYFAIEGFKLIEEAIRSGAKLGSVIFSETGAPRADRLLPQLNSRTEAVVKFLRR